MSKGLTVDYRTPLEEGQQLYARAAEQVVQTIASSGFVLPQVPRFVDQNQNPLNGQLPPNLTDLTDDQLGWWLGYLSSWSDYVQNKLAEAELQMNSCAAALEFVEADLRISYKYDEHAKKRTDTERKDRVRIDRRYVEARTQSLYTESVYRYTNAIARAAERNWNSVSRRITQRGQDLERHRRDQGVGSITAPFRRG